MKGAKAMKTKTHLILGCPASGALPRNAERDPRFIQYLLGELPERTKLEDQYLGDQETFERLVAAQEELICTYVRGAFHHRESGKAGRALLPAP